MYNRLTNDEINDRVEEYLKIKKLTPSDLLHCDILFHDSYNFMFKYCDYKIIRYNGKFILITCVDSLYNIEPFYIQVDDYGFLLDEFFNSFISEYKPSADYYILESDYKTLIERVNENSNLFVIENYF